MQFERPAVLFTLPTSVHHVHITLGLNRADHGVEPRTNRVNIAQYLRSAGYNANATGCLRIESHSSWRTIATRICATENSDPPDVRSSKVVVHKAKASGRCVAAIQQTWQQRNV